MTAPAAPASTPGQYNIDGLVYLLNQSGEALAEANRRILGLSEENNNLRMVVEAAQKAQQSNAAPTDPVDVVTGTASPSSEVQPLGS